MNKIVRTIGLLLIAWLPLMASAQTGSFLELSAGGGWSTLTYSLKDAPATLNASQNGSYGFNIHAGYGYLIVPCFGIGIGVDVSRYGAAANLSGTMRWEGVTDTDGEKYNHIAQVHRWNDQQQLYYIELPVTLYGFIPTSTDLQVAVELGVKYAYPFLRHASYEAQVTHTGEYPQWGLTLYEMPNHGFGDETLSGKNTLPAQHQLIAFAKVGVTYPVATNTYLFANAYADCGLRNAIGSLDGAAPFGLQQDAPEAKTAHYFMSPAVSVLQTNIPTGSFLPVSAGLEIGVRFLFPPKKKYPCRCLLRT